jgi:hypothetical protein
MRGLLAIRDLQSQAYFIPLFPCLFMETLVVSFKPLKIMVVEAVIREPVSTLDFPFERENNGNFGEFGSSDTVLPARTRKSAWVRCQNSRERETGNNSERTGKPSHF